MILSRSKKAKSVLYCIVIAIVLIIFPVLSGVFLGTMTALTGKDYQASGAFIQAFFMVLPIIIMGVYLKKQKISLDSIDINFKLQKRCLWFLPCLLIYLPLLFLPFSWKGTAYFAGNLLLYLAVGIAEELYFRGVIPHILKEAFHKYSTILIAVFIFGFGHSSVAFSGSDYKVVLLSILNALIFGWLAMELKYLTHNITILMLIHFLFNFQSKFVIATSTQLFYSEIMRGTIMVIYAILLLIVMKTNDARRNNKRAA